MENLQNLLLQETEGATPEVHLAARRATTSHLADYRKALASDEYCPGVMLNFVTYRLGAKNDFALSLALGCSPDEISRVRNRRKPIGDALLVRISEATDIGTKELKRLAGML